MSETIRDSRGTTLGRIDTRSDGSQVVYDARGNTLGRYDPRTNKTYDARGNVVGPGNQLIRLL